MRRAIVIVLDGCGAGAAPDASEFGDDATPNTLQHVWDACGGLNTPHLVGAGFFGAATGLEGFGCQFGRLQPMSKGGKDSVTGHWEMMGIVMGSQFPTYPNGFPDHLVKRFCEGIGRAILGNCPASGTQIIDQLGEEHMRTGAPILYTSADSVFQVAAHEDIVPIDRLYDWCSFARSICTEPDNVQRVIARPFEGAPGAFRRTERRKDFPLEAPAHLLDRLSDTYGIGVVPELFGGRGFRPTSRTQSNPEHQTRLDEALSSDAKFIFANFEDFDMLYGHRNDPKGFGKCLEAFDAYLGTVLPRLGDDDLLILTADHGNDPTTPSTDHTREFVPYVAIGRSLEGKNLGDQNGFSHVGQSVETWLAS